MLGDVLRVLLLVLAVCGVFAWVPLLFLLHDADRRVRRRRRPIDELLKEAVAEGRITMAQFEGMLGEVHEAMGGIDRPYPEVREFEEAE